MATYSATKEAAGVQPKFLPTGGVWVYSSFALTQALALNDIIKMLDVPAGATIIDVILSTDALDTNATSTIKYDVGDGTTANRFIAAAAQGNNTTLPPTHSNVAAGLGYNYAAQTTIQVKVNTGPATGATSGTVRLAVCYSMDP